MKLTSLWGYPVLQNLEFEQLLVEFGIKEEGRQMLRPARKDGPVRKVMSNMGNSTVYHYSRKMGGVHLEMESRTVEGAAVWLYETDPTILEIWPQAIEVDMPIYNADGVAVTRIQHIPDFICINKIDIVVHEWRMEGRLNNLAKEGDQFYKDENGRWHFKAAEEFFKKIGLKYELHSNLELPQTFIQNTRFLEAYQLPTSVPLDENVEAKLANLVSERGAVPFLELIHNQGYDADDIFKAIVKGAVVVDLYQTRLDEPNGLVIYRDYAFARAHERLTNDLSPVLPIPGMGNLAAGSRIMFNGKIFEVMLVGGGNVLLRSFHE